VPGPRRHHLLHRADRDPLADQGQRANPDHPTKYDLSKLRMLGTVGEPINPEAWMWYYNNVGSKRCPIVDTFWQTETGGHMITPLPGATPLVPGSCTLPLPGIMAAIVDETGHDVPNGQGGLLVVKRPWPSMIRTIWGDPERFRKSYYPAELGGKLYLAGDGSIRDKETGYFTIVGRIDDVLNVSGHRMGTMEIESALVSQPMVAEAAVVGRPDDTTGEAISAFVVLKQARPTGDDALRIARSCATGLPRRSARSPSRRTSASATTCRRRAAARSCAACCARSPRARRSRRTSRRWRTRRSWISSR
jgi:acyl-coenzyme A synthetase/AMP-(fatty) acid ligase